MNARFPDHDTSTALSLATRAPSIHNSQPWRWRVAPRVCIYMPIRTGVCPTPIRTAAICC